MYLPKTIYEPLPYFYFVLSAYLILQQSSWALAASGLLFYLAGTVVIVKRSENRRLDKQRNTLDHYKLPNTLYEFLPFIYIAMGVLIVVNTVTPIPQLAGGILFVIACRNLVCRHLNRSRSPSSKRV